LSDVSQGPGWWQASDGKWYPPKEAESPPAPGWWLAADGKWYPPKESDEPPQPGWWLASDGKWYPPREPDPESRVAAPTPLEVRDRSAPEASSDDIDDVGAEPISPARLARAARTTQPTRKKQGPLPERPPRIVEAAKSTAGTSRGPAEQIRRRNEASRQDAMAQAPARFLAAARVVQMLETEVKIPSPPPRSPAKSRTASKTTAAKPADQPELDLDLDAAVTTSPELTAEADDGSDEFVDHLIEDLRPLIEVRSSPLGADIDHLGDRLVVYVDRVELHDRMDNVRQVLAAAEIADVVVLRRFTGAIITVESLSGDDIVLKGAKPDLADTAAALIENRTRQGQPRRPRPQSSAPVRAMPGAPPADGSPEANQADAANRLAILNRDQLNEADLLRKLADLHRAGVLSDSEFQEKIALVGRLVSGETVLVR
jgi:hypothetical protein